MNDPVLMVVEQESLCWMTGRLSDEVSGEAWAQEFRQFPNLEQVARDGGKGLEKGVALVNAPSGRRQGKPPMVDKGDHFHALRGGSVGLHKDEMQARKALAEAEAAEKELEECRRQGTSRENRNHPRPCGLARGRKKPWTPGVNVNGSGKRPRRPCACLRPKGN